MLPKPLAPLFARLPKPATAAIAIAAAFGTYFCMYAFRHPYAAVSYDEIRYSLFGGEFEGKTIFAIAQVFGYALSKWIGTKVVPETVRSRRAPLILGLVFASELALIAFAVLPNALKPAALFFNGLPLGMIWGLVVWSLEGRRGSDFMLAALSVSFIVSSGLVKDAGRWLLSVSEMAVVWMPAATGALFFPLLVLFVWVLDQVPPPDAEDESLKTKREPMNHEARAAFFRAFAPGLLTLFLAYVLLTALRDFRDLFGAEILSELKVSGDFAFSRIEWPVGLTVLAILGLLALVRNNRRALFLAQVLMALGFLLTGLATVLSQQGLIGGEAWMILIGIGLYLAYVPYNSMLFDRLVAATKTSGTAVFAIYLADSLGYLGSVSLQVWKDFFAAEQSRLGFFQGFAIWVAGTGVLCLLFSVLWFDRKAASAERNAAAKA